MIAPEPARFTDPATALRLQAAALHSQADALTALADSLGKPAAHDDLLTADQTLAEYGVGRDGLKNAADRGELTLSRGARGKLLIARAELRRWLDARPYKARKTAPVGDDYDALAAELACGGLVRAA